MQIRLFHKGRAVKGTLLVNKRLSPRTIVIRPSMIKVQTDSKLSNLPTFNSLEIVRTSEKPKKAYLSKNLIALLSYGGVPNKFFLDLMESALKDAQTIYFDERTAFRVALNYGEMDENLVVSMITCNIPLNEPCLQSRLAVFANQERSGLKNLKLPVSETFYLMGTVDPTGRLERHQVCVILESGQVSGHVLVYRNPGLHFGDVHLFEATYVEELEHFVGNAKYGIFFSTKGPRSVGSELANGDFDGDVYWVSKNHELLKDFKVSEPWSRIYSTPCKPEKKKPNEMSADELEKELFNLFLRTRLQKSNCMGVAADSWIAFMDRLLILDESCVDEKNNMKRLMQELVDVYYDALDAPKSGKQVVIRDKLIVRKFPHYMEREPKFNSTSILGILYDMVQSYHYVDPATCGENIWKLPCFDFEIPPACMELWRERHNTYRSDMSAALRSPEKETNDVAADGVIQKYKKLLYDAPEFEDSPRNPEDIFNEAIAIYHVCYNRAIQMGDTKCCLFAWRVAGPALFKFYVDKQRERNQRPIICLPSVLRKLFA